VLTLPVKTPHSAAFSTLRPNETTRITVKRTSKVFDDAQGPISPTKDDDDDQQQQDDDDENDDDDDDDDDDRRRQQQTNDDDSNKRTNERTTNDTRHKAGFVTYFSVL